MDGVEYFESDEVIPEPHEFAVQPHASIGVWTTATYRLEFPRSPKPTPTYVHRDQQSSGGIHPRGR